METKARLPALGEVVAGRYRLDAVLGRGGMGTVFKAEHLNLSKTFALKMLMAADFDDLASRRFKMEAQLAGNLSHPNIVNITDFGIDNNRPFIVMDYLKGRSLDRILQKESRLPVERFEHVMVQACRALGYAHRSGVVHRDVKLSNMMLVERGGERDVLVIVDFGLMKVLTDRIAEQKSEREAQPLTTSGARSTGDQSLTDADTVVGSPLYMSPEQIRAEKIDHRTDIYSLGCVMYQCLTGVVPFEGQNTHETFMKHVFDPPPAFEAAGSELNLPPALEAVVRKALSKNPDDRQQDMQELADEISNAVRKRRPLEHVDARQLSAESSLLNSQQIKRLHGNNSRNAIMVAVAVTFFLAMFIIAAKLLGPLVDQSAGLNQAPAEQSAGEAAPAEAEPSRAGHIAPAHHRHHHHRKSKP